MPSHEEADQFWRDWAGLSPEQRAAFRNAVGKFVADLSTLPPGQFRGGLRVKPMQGAKGIWEMTWNGEDGRATFEYGEALTAGDPHIVWRRVGGHEIFRNP